MSSTVTSTSSPGELESRFHESGYLPSTTLRKVQNYDHLNLPENAVLPYYTSTVINAWTETFSPYTTAEQRLAISVWISLAPSMSRSQQGLDYWSVAVPTIAWGHSSVRNAVMATSTVFHSLRKKDGPAEYAVAQAKGLAYANKCIRELLSTAAPPEAMIASATLLWIFEMLSGRYRESLTHLAAGSRISKYTRLSTLSEPLIAQYIRSFVGGLPTPVNPEDITSMSAQDQEAQCDARHHYAQHIMRDALGRLATFQERLNASQSRRKDRAIQMISRNARELDRINQRWPIKTFLDERPASIQEVITKHSPFVQVIEKAEIFFQDDDLTHIVEFETWFRPCIDHFIWLAACLHLHDRQQLVEIWAVVRQPLPLTNRLLPTTEIEDT